MISKTIWTCKKCGKEFYPCEDSYKENRFAHYDGNVPIKLCNGEVVPVIWFQAASLDPRYGTWYGHDTDVGNLPKAIKELFEKELTTDWFIDDRKGLHCCFCGVTRENNIHTINLFNHKKIKHIICEVCLDRLKSIEANL